ncbi:capsule biosynthesis GfcC family protein [Frateuria hangzhouensis]|uniref:capsule biosynthesis GfcC family protein n=1 Tax=Frateuria hangzhouensis TaxID=2995589 RepID=UPI0022609408|nr:capsule biosynthesis GfcC family protein [Frateuria sp. STR12]MCX7515277.1 capsule biosynthesis GfcC family protein [Frateuria sp. STR12]
MRAWVLVLALLAVMPVRAVTVRVEGRVVHAGAQALPEGARLADALLAAEVEPDAYVLGAAWLRPSLQPAQRRLKAGVLYDLEVLAGEARLGGDADLLALAQRLAQTVRALPITGRAREALLDPRPLELSPKNHLLADGDRVLFPARPGTIRVTGAVQRDCRLPHQPLRDARDYLADCALAAPAESDWLYVIQPDGAVTRLGTGLWNRAAAQPLAPGAMLYVPIRQSAASAVDPALNDQLAQLLATQPLPEAQP